MLAINAVAKPDECTFPKPNIKRQPYDLFSFNQTDWSNKLFTQATQSYFYINNNNKNISHFIPVISAVIFKNSGWEIDEIKNRFLIATQILQQCKVHINSVNIIHTEAPNKTGIIRHHRTCYNPEPNGEHFITNQLPYLPGIRAFFINKFIIGPAGTAFNLKRAANTPIENTIWLAKNHLNNNPAHALYEIVAHELGHILLNEGHTNNDQPNLMSAKPSKLNNELNDLQCNKIRQSPLVYKL